MIQTVRGNIQPKQMGITMAHEHLSIDLSPVRKNDDSTFGYGPQIITEVKKAQALGVQTFVEVTCNDMGRNIYDLKKISETCDIHIIASTGFYLQEYHNDKVKEASCDEIAALFIKDLTEGIDDTDIKAGVIGEVASSESMSESERKVLEAAGIAAKQVGCAITTHCQMGTLGDEQAAIFQSAGVNSTKIILGHIDLSDDVDYMKSLLDRGFNLGFDTIGKESYLSDASRVLTLKTLLNQGYEKQIVLSQDISRKSYFTDQKGYITVMNSFIPKLLQQGIKQEVIDKLLIENPQRIFNIEM